MGHVRENKNGGRWTTFGVNNGKKNSPIYFAKISLLFILETKSSLSTSVFIFFAILQILKTKFYAQTCRNLKSIK